MNYSATQADSKLANWQIFGILVVINLGILWFVKEYIFRYDVLYRFFQEQVELSQIEHNLELLRNWFNLNYLLVPFSLLIKFSFLAFVLQLPLLFIVDDIPYKNIFRVVMIADLAMIGCSILHYTVLFLKPLSTLETETFGRIPLSLAVLLQDFARLSDPAKMIVNKFNAFELIWCAMVYYQLKALTGLKSIDVLLLVISIWTFLLLIQWLGVELFMLLSI